MNIRWAPQALEDLASLYAFIARDNPPAARRMVQRVVTAVEALLPDHPNMGRAGRVPGTRELAIAGTPYIVPYRIRQNALQILAVHLARGNPRALVHGAGRNRSDAPSGEGIIPSP